VHAVNATVGEEVQQGYLPNLSMVTGELTLNQLYSGLKSGILGYLESIVSSHAIMHFFLSNSLPPSTSLVFDAQVLVLLHDVVNSEIVLHRKV
jgi:hypothetical protein